MAEYIINVPQHEINNVVETMRGESDRGCVLVGASLIEWQMERLLKIEFLSHHEEPSAKLYKQIQLMLDPTSEKSILGAAAPRARMCRLLNLISEATHDVLKKFFVFRNQHFAHARSNVSFSDPKIAVDLDGLSLALPVVSAQEASKTLQGRIKYIYVVAGLFMLLDTESQTSQPSSS